MKVSHQIFFIKLVLVASQLTVSATLAGVQIQSGSYKPLFGSNGEKLNVKTFWLDGAAVTNADFFKFVETEKKWRKENAKTEFVDKNYLSHWRKNGRGFSPKKGEESRPVTHISWYAASVYCEVKGGRLPTTLEWEYVAAASRDKRDATEDPKFQEKVLAWYTTRTPQANALSASEANFYGVRGLHGSIWEWTSDFNAFFVTADSRQDGDQAKNFFCGGAATGAANRDSYPAFMRYALRSSLQANYSLNNLGFRCAYGQAN